MYLFRWKSLSYAKDEENCNKMMMKIMTSTLSILQNVVSLYILREITSNDAMLGKSLENDRQFSVPQ